MQEILDQITSFLPTAQVMVFGPLAIFVGLSALLVAITRNLFHNALALIATLFGVSAIYALLEAEFVAVSQVLVYVGAISTLITFAIMLTRGMMYGATSRYNRQMLAGAVTAALLFAVLLGLVFNVPWPEVKNPVEDGQAIIARLGVLFVTDYLVAFELLALLLLAALSGALLLARDRK